LKSSGVPKREEARAWVKKEMRKQEGGPRRGTWER
jgi:hypothetical protein